MDTFRVAVKAFIVQEDKVLLVKRRPNDVQKPSQWEIPGGRLELGEDPYRGLKREVREETSLDIKIELPLDVHHFERADRQLITMIIFLCTPLTTDVKLSEEHTDFMWKSVSDPTAEFENWLQPIIERIKKYTLI